MDEQLSALVAEVGHVRWFHFSAPSKNTSVHGSLSAKKQVGVQNEMVLPETIGMEIVSSIMQGL
jgi:hypothetical protein